jgi:hypothetical protein
MFSDRHYVPVLRWKAAERSALAAVEPAKRTFITPLIEPVPRLFRPSKRNPNADPTFTIGEIAQHIRASWGRSPFFVDFLHLNGSDSPEAASALRLFTPYARAVGLTVIPVTGLNRSTAYQEAVAAAVRTNQAGVCIRLCRDDTTKHALASELTRLLAHLNLSHEDSDLIIDLAINRQSDPGFGPLCASAPVLGRWRTFTILSGAFPANLTGMPLGPNLRPRLDWRRWRNQSRTSLPRRPAFGDYTIQHPVFSEPVDFPNVSASIRYTIESDWLIMRGEGVQNEGGAGYDQWPANALLLSEQPQFCGSRFSYGDRYIADKAVHPQQPGNPRTWLQAGINHHLVFVIRQIASLTGLSAAAEP